MTSVQLMINAAILIAATAMIIGGVIVTRREVHGRTPGGTIPGAGIGIALGGVAGVLFGIDLARSYALGWGSSLFGRWGFLPAAQPGNGLDSALGSPIIGLLALGVLTFFLGVPSWAQLRDRGRRLASPKTRREAILTGAGVVAILAVCVLAAWFVYISTGLALLGMLAFFGSFAVQAAVITTIGILFSKRSPAGGETTSNQESSQ